MSAQSRSSTASDAALVLCEQALLDVAVAGSAEVAFVLAEEGGERDAFLAGLEERASAMGFIVADVRVTEEQSFDVLDGVVRGVARSMRAADVRPRARGLAALLDAFAKAHGPKAATRLDEQALRTGASGDVTALARAYLAALAQPSKLRRRIEAWLDGTELGRVAPGEPAFAALSKRTAKRALADISRLVRALGYEGSVLIVRDADQLTKLPAARRQSAYTVLRELVDNADGGRGMSSLRMFVVGGASLFSGPRSLASLAPLASRIQATEEPSSVWPPHRPFLSLEGSRDSAHRKRPVAPDPARARELRAVIRASHGLPPTESVLSMTVGPRAIDAAIDQLFACSAVDGSVFAILSGPYGSGKTHLLLHMAERALADRRPVLRLSLERLDSDLGNPQRHLRRLLEHATLPMEGRIGPLDLLDRWTHDEASLEGVVWALEDIAREGGDAGFAASRALRGSARTRARHISGFLGAADLTSKPGGASYRHDAYCRLLLWFSLLARLEGFLGPVLLIDEAENLFKSGMSPAQRRTALRSLAFYCGGTLPRACVVLAITPELLVRLQDESQGLLDELTGQKTLLASEDATMLARRLARARPIDVPRLAPEDRRALLSRVRKTHERVRGTLIDEGWARFLRESLSADASTRALVRSAVDRLESLWWKG